MAQQYTNIRIVLDRVMRHPLLRDMTLETAVDYCVDFIREMGVPDIYFDKTEEIDSTIEQHRISKGQRRGGNTVTTCLYEAEFIDMLIELSINNIGNFTFF